MPNAIRAAILDDERGSIETLKALLIRDCPEVEVVATWEYPDEALDALPALAPDLLFLDVEMDEMDGFAVLDQLPADWRGEVIFVTAYEQYFYRHYDYAALDYLVKPVKSERLQEALRRYQVVRQYGDFPLRRRVWSENRKAAPEARSMVVEGHLVEPRTPGVYIEETMVVSTLQKRHVLRFEEILYLEGDGAYTLIYMTRKRKVYSSRSLGYFEARMAGDGLPFFRIHKSFIVNTRFVRAYKTAPAEVSPDTEGPGETAAGPAPAKELRWVVELPEAELPVARRKVGDFRVFMRERNIDFK